MSFRSASGNKVLKKTLLNKVKEGLAWSRFVGKGLAEDHEDLVNKSPTNENGEALCGIKTLLPI